MIEGVTLTERRDGGAEADGRPREGCVEGGGKWSEGWLEGGGKAAKVLFGSGQDSRLLDGESVETSPSSSLRFLARLRWFWNQFVMLWYRLE